ncbi:MAG: glycosyltransferase [Bacteroidetes bacterium]|nr:glycosyltransferase [Bacteroidota bacterium]
MKGISVILCCYNSADRLPETLRHIASQDLPEYLMWEIILVNNSSTDDTRAIAVKEWEQYFSLVPFRVIDQPIRGLSSARAKGISEAKFDYLIFCDDDNWLDPDYVRTAFKIMENHPDIGIAGGQLKGFFETDEPDWFRTFSQSFAIEQPLVLSGDIPPERGYVAGAGMILRKEFIETLEKLQFIQILSDRTGNNLLSGGDTELCLIARFAGFRIYYDESLKLTHYMPKERLTWDYCLKMTTFGHAIPEIYLDIYRMLFKDKEPGYLIFSKLYRTLLMKNLYDLLFPEGLSFLNCLKCVFNIKYFIKLFPGSMIQQRILSAKNRLLFLLKNKRELSDKFVEINAFVNRLKEYKSQISSNNN